MNKIVALRIVLLLAAAALTASFARPASAQFGGIDFGGTTRRYTPEEKERMEEIDKNYKETIKKVPDKQKAYDPWAGARQDLSQDSSNGSTTKR